jgi:hypothetical protein
VTEEGYARRVATLLGNFWQGELAGIGSELARDQGQTVATYRSPMPEVSRFFGIVITINYDDHLPPHFHARYGDDRATFGLDGSLLAGSTRAKGLVRQ